MTPNNTTPSLEQFRQSAREAVADLALTAKASSGVLSSEYLDGRIAALEAAAEELVEQELSSLLEHGKFITESKGRYCFECNYVTHADQYKGFDLTCKHCGNGVAYTPMTAVREDIKRRIVAIQSQRKQVEEDSDE